MNYDEEALKMHAQLKGKLEVKSKIRLKTKDDLSTAYTPGVAAVSRAIHADKSKAEELTIKANCLAVVSDGSAVLGLGNIGAEAAIPVMEGKAVIFKEFGKINAFPICCASQDKDEIIRFVKNLAPVFGAINLEDIGAPKCFEIENSLQDLGIPVMHDDQHGTAVVILAALINASKIVKKEVRDMKIVISGAGAAGDATARLISDYHSPDDLLVCDTKGIIYRGRPDLESVEHKKQLSMITNKENQQGTLKDALVGADVFIGVSAPNLLRKEDIQKMNENAIVFAMANPVPEIMPDEAKAGGAAVVGTGRSDFPNQVNNSLSFPGLFRGALDAKAKQISHEMKIAAALAIAKSKKNPTAEDILPSSLDKKVHKAVAKAVRKAA